MYNKEADFTKVKDKFAEFVDKWNVELDTQYFAIEGEMLE